METAFIKNEIKKIIISSMHLNMSTEDIQGKDLIAELGINSIDALEVFVWIENTFDIQIDDEDLSSELLGSIDYLANYIQKKIEKQTLQKSDD
jgi:acyl carrier protein